MTRRERVARRLLVAGCLAATFLLNIPAPAGAVGPCPGPFLPLVTPAGEHPDRNGNGVVCFNVVANGGRFVFVDDNGQTL